MKSEEALGELEEKVQKAVGFFSKARERIDTLNRENKNLESSYEKLKTDYASLQKELEEMTERQTKVEVRLEKILADLDTWVGDIDESSESSKSPDNS